MLNIANCDIYTSKLKKWETCFILQVSKGNNIDVKISYFVNVKKFNKEAIQLSMDYGQTWMQQFEIKKNNDLMLSVLQIITQSFYFYQLNILGS